MYVDLILYNRAMTDPLLFENKIALITGSGRGIGRAIALHFARQGADIFVNYFRNRAPAQATVNEIQALGRRAWMVKADVGTLEGIQVLFDRVELETGGLDFLICNAATGYNRPAMQQKPRGWDWTMNANARSLLFSAQRAAPLMEAGGGGAIVSLTSQGSSRVLPDYVVVGASKAALEAITRYLAVELAPKNIVVNAVSPGMVLTEALKSFNALRKDDDLVEHAISLTPAGRLVTPEDVAGVVAFLCSPAGNMIRGQVIVVDGGYTLPIAGVNWGGREQV
jgi:enoyl-[acyl-carrier protein] reductase III